MDKRLKVVSAVVLGVAVLGVAFYVFWPRHAPQSVPQPPPVAEETRPAPFIPKVEAPAVSNPNLAHIDDLYPLTLDKLNPQSSAEVEKYAALARADADAMQDPVAANNLRDRLDQSVSDVHFALASRAYSCIKDPSLCYGDGKVLTDLCAAVGKDGVKKRITALQGIMDDNMAKTKTSPAIFRTTPLPHDDEGTEAEITQAQQDVQDTISARFAEADDLSGCQ